MRNFEWMQYIPIVSFQFGHGTIIRTEITYKTKIPCYMRDSACRWVVLLLKKLKHFEVMLNIL